mmetsp:Transcript_46340/g.68391  ORF Transcript_46340/g.68391 Transcript_46340/m.68391 type:complete len:113 (+) Transcript_46340:245-583(+)
MFGSFCPSEALAMPSSRNDFLSTDVVVLPPPPPVVEEPGFVVEERSDEEEAKREEKSVVPTAFIGLLVVEEVGLEVEACDRAFGGECNCVERDGFSAAVGIVNYSRLVGSTR